MSDSEIPRNVHPLQASEVKDEQLKKASSLQPNPPSPSFQPSSSSPSLQQDESSAALQLDKDFDIDKLLGASNGEASTVMESDEVPEITDDEFLNQFPDIDIRPKTPAKSNANPRTIVEYGVPSSSPKISQGSTPTRNTPSTSKGIQRPYNATAVKRRLNDIMAYQSTSSKRQKTAEGLMEANGIIVYENNSENDDEDDIDLDEYDKENELDDMYTMPFPIMGEDINFDVSAIPKKPQTNSFVNHLGDKQMQNYLRERSLTTECIEKLYNSLMNIPRDGMERDPRGLNTQLMPHQRQALKWMKWREEQSPSGGILADDMGLGKTLQLISLVLAAKNEKKQKENVNDDSDDDSDDDDWRITSKRIIYDGKTLVVCPASLINQWEREVTSKCKRDQLKVYIYHGITRTINARVLSKYDIVVTTYNLVQQEYELDMVPTDKRESKLFKIVWERVILDEAHYIRNYKSKISKAACELRGKSRWALTGTPIQNKEADLFALLKFVRCKPFDDWPVWRKWVNNRNEAGYKRLTIITKSLMLRRTKAELMEKGLIQGLPEKKLNVIDIKLDREEMIVYQKLLLYSQSFFHEFLRQRQDREHLRVFGCHSRSLIRQEVPDKLSRLMKVLMRYHRQIEPHYILVLILRLRQMCCHPALIKSMLDKEDIDLVDNKQVQNVNTAVMEELNKLMSDDEDDDDDEFKIDELVAKNVMSKTNPVFKHNRKSSKVRAVLEILEEVIERGEKAVVVSQWTSFLDVIARNLNFMRDAHYGMFTGKIHVDDRQDIIDRLNDNNDRLNILLLSLTAGGVGLNLVGANNLLIIDLHWNPQLETQAEDRIHRFGQESNVRIYKFLCKDTIEEKIKVLQQRKLDIAGNVLNGTVSHQLTIEDLKLLFS